MSIDEFATMVDQFVTEYEKSTSWAEQVSIEQNFLAKLKFNWPGVAEELKAKGKADES